MAKRREASGPLYGRLERLELDNGKINFEISGEGERLSGRVTAQLALYVLYRLGEIFLTGAPVKPMPVRDRERASH